MNSTREFFCFFSILSCFSGKVLFKNFLLETGFLLARSRLLLTLYFNLFTILYIRDCEPSPEQTDQAWAALKAILNPPKVPNALLSENNPHVKTALDCSFTESFHQITMAIYRKQFTQQENCSPSSASLGSFSTNPFYKHLSPKTLSQTYKRMQALGFQQSAHTSVWW